MNAVLQNASGSLTLRSGLVVCAKAEPEDASEFLERQVKISVTQLLSACLLHGSSLPHQRCLSRATAKFQADVYSVLFHSRHQFAIAFKIFAKLP